MNKLSKKEIIKIFKTLNFDINNMDKIGGIDVYHIHEWDHGYDGHTGFCGSRREFYKDYFVMQGFLKEYIRINNLSTAILTPLYPQNYFNGITGSAYDIYYEIKDYLEEHKIDKRYGSGLKISVDESFKIIDAICEGGYRNISNICIIFDEDKTVFVPCHHMNMYIHTNLLEEKYAQITNIIRRYPDLQMVR